LTETNLDLPTPGDDEVLFVALGGLGEIGMNLALYGHAGKWIAVDMGVTFGDEDTPGVDVIVPDISVIDRLGDKLEGVLITHAHEDHIGAIPYLAGRFKCPVFTSPFAAAFLRRKLEDDGGRSGKRVKIIEIPSGGRRDVGPFNVELIPMPHSVAEAHLTALRSKAGMVIHTGDWKLDPGPVVGKPADEDRLAALGEEGVAMLVCDSTNALREGWTRSESELTEPMTEIIKARDRRVLFACFSSNVARLRTIAEAAKKADRQVGLVGRSLWRMYDVAGSQGYLKGLPPFLKENELAQLPANKIVAICTGSQGEPRAALHRIADGQHRHVQVEAADTVVFSSRDIPGNEKSIGRLQNRLVAMGVDVVTDGTAKVHVSGHPARDELKHLYSLLKPARLLPAHGEGRHLHGHAKWGLECGIPEAKVAFNGDVLRLAGGDFEELTKVKVGRIGLDGNARVALDGVAMKERRLMRLDGVGMITIVLDDKGRLAADSMVTLAGLDAADDEDLLEAAEVAVDEAVEELAPKARRDDAPVEDAARSALRRVLRKATGKRPRINVHIARV
jgi:ribonuclease J